MTSRVLQNGVSFARTVAARWPTTLGKPNKKPGMASSYQCRVIDSRRGVSYPHGCVPAEPVYVRAMQATQISYASPPMARNSSVSPLYRGCTSHDHTSANSGFQRIPAPHTSYPRQLRSHPQFRAF